MRRYQWASKKFQATSQIHLMMGQFLYYFNEKKQTSLNALHKTETRQPRLDEQFTCYFFRKLAEKEFITSDANKDIISYCTLRLRHMDSFQALHTCCLMFIQCVLYVHFV